MAWRGLLRVVDFQRLLTAQAEIAEALDAAVHAAGAESPEARTLREGFNLLAKVLFTRRAGIADVHDLAWLDHLVVSKDALPSEVWEGPAYQEAWDRLASTQGRMGELVPRGRLSTWAQVPIEGFGGADAVKLERGVAASFRVGLVTHDGILELMDELAGAGGGPHGPELVKAMQRLAVAVRHVGREPMALVLVSADL